MNRAKSQNCIIQQELALDVYLRTLLDVVPEAEFSPEPTKTVESILETPLRPALTPEKLPSKVATEVVQSENQSKLFALCVMPEWAQQEFQALFFKVDQLILATPLVDLSRTIKLERNPTMIPGQPSWFLGLLDVQDARIGVLDTGQLLFGKSRGGLRNLETNPFRRILITQDKKWGLACDDVVSIGRLKPDKVRWRTSRKKKPWLVGTVIEELTAVIDVRQLVPHRKNTSNQTPDQVI